ncbi:dTDP-glucose 4,6-dehydratase [Pelagibacterium sp. H642]|uniref:dTDP-glucose 4,6-dehydratase n=1 Tax=Pelagibacterium sp. H642 TaxID=1881069 RepID=UPI0028162345|nr:dTDP-glucose 4,6-dehydratase [Pelagibacterium sp. H642]WMT92845.1 dTDP-glucose 4,6-dehydratase [Pelagibacterium sp. H642]
MNILVTGGAGFIGSALCRVLAEDPSNHVVAFDKLTYAANLGSLRELNLRPNFKLVCGDICDGAFVLETLRTEAVERVFHLAAETHVDRSIQDPEPFLNTNIYGTACLLGAALTFWQSLPPKRKAQFRLHHVSTDEVFGDLPFDDSLFSEETPYAPSSPYSASKAASDHLVHAWHRTYGLPVTISHCSNNYGPFHNREKLIPMAISNALEGRDIPVYGSGKNVRDWLYVEDHVDALIRIADAAQPGSRYAIGGNSQRTNLEVVLGVCCILDQKHRKETGGSYIEQVCFVVDRPGHDRRYAIDTSDIERDLGWRAAVSFETGLERTVDWFLANTWWWRLPNPIPAQTDIPLVLP